VLLRVIRLRALSCIQVLVGSGRVEELGVMEGWTLAAEKVPLAYSYPHLLIYMAEEGYWRFAMGCRKRKGPSIPGHPAWCMLVLLDF
jgi:hypothetical protein